MVSLRSADATSGAARCKNSYWCSTNGTRGEMKCKQHQQPQPQTQPQTVPVHGCIESPHRTPWSRLHPHSHSPARHQQSMRHPTYKTTRTSTGAANTTNRHTTTTQAPHKTYSHGIARSTLSRVQNSHVVHDRHEQPKCISFNTQGVTHCDQG